MPVALSLHYTDVYLYRYDVVFVVIIIIKYILQYTRAQIETFIIFFTIKYLRSKLLCSLRLLIVWPNDNNLWRVTGVTAFAPGHQKRIYLQRENCVSSTNNKYPSTAFPISGQKRFGTSIDNYINGLCARIIIRKYLP